MKKESKKQRSERILNQLRKKYPSANCFDVDGKRLHFAAEIEPAEKHPEYDRCIEVIVASSPHKHFKMTHEYRVISGIPKLHIEDNVYSLKPGDTCTISPNKVHWVESGNDEECWIENYSRPGWTREDHILVD